MDGSAGGVEENAADLAADFGTAWFDGFDDCAAVFAQILGEQAELRGFAAAVHAFECEEVALRCQEASIFADGGEWAGLSVSAASVRRRLPGWPARVPAPLRSGVRGDGIHSRPRGDRRV